MKLLIQESGVHTELWATLPSHLLQHIFAHCAHSSFNRLGLVCQAWRVETYRESWRRFCKLERIATAWIDSNKSLNLSFSDHVSTWIQQNKPIQFMPQTIRLFSDQPQPKLRLARPACVVLVEPTQNKIIKFALATSPAIHQFTLSCPTGTLELLF